MAQRGTGTSNRGFASMDPEKQRAIAAQGGRAAHAQGVAHVVGFEARVGVLRVDFVARFGRARGEGGDREQAGDEQGRGGALHGGSS